MGETLEKRSRRENIRRLKCKTRAITEKNWGKSHPSGLGPLSRRPPGWATPGCRSVREQVLAGDGVDALVEAEVATVDTEISCSRHVLIGHSAFLHLCTEETEKGFLDPSHGVS